MQSFGARALATVGFSFLIALTAACGGSKPEARSPNVEVADTSGVGSITPVPSPEGSAGDTSPSAASSADDGSDIIPPFSTGKEPAAKKPRPAKRTKKASSKRRKKKR